MKDPNWWPDEPEVKKADRAADVFIGVLVGIVAGYFLVQWIMIG